MRLPVPESLEKFARSWREIVRPPRLRALVAAWILGVSGALLLAREGTGRARLFAAAAIALGVALTVLWSRLERRTFSDAKRIVARLFGRTDPQIAARAERALSLAYAPSEGTSEALAKLHLNRAILALPSERVDTGARRAAFAFGVAALILAGASLGTCGLRGFGVIEGADVLVSRNGRAPVDLAYLVTPEMVARPPEYLHEPETHSHVGANDVMLPRGTLITIRGRPVHDGRTLLLTDGASRVPFFDDGSGKMVARWPLANTADLRVAALFGDVVIEEPQVLHIQSIADDPPHVILESAPREVKLAEDTEVSDISLRYEATDDHGMREVHLVLRAGAKEERRMLAKLDGETRTDRGGTTLRVSDPFVRKSHVPVFVTVEAKDNDAVTGPKWGKSEAIVLVPPAVGEPEALRLAGLRKVRDAYVDSLARRLTVKMAGSAIEKRKIAETEATHSENDRDLLNDALRVSYIGLHVQKRLSTLLLTHAIKIDKAIGALSKAPSQTTLDDVTASTEKFVTIVDAVIEGIAMKDARASAKELADVADDVALGFAGMDSQSGLEGAPEPKGARARVSAGHSVLASGEGSLGKLGPLGHDLGEIIGAYLLRIDRADTAHDALHAALAARDLAARLAVPDPSLGAHGRGGRGGAESGGTPGGEDEGESSGDEVANAFDEAARGVQQLAIDHAEEIGKVDKETSQTSREDLKQMEGELKERADRVRKSVKNLPEVGASPDSKEGQARAAREQAEQMAKSLDEGNVNDALSAGKSALSHLEEAKRAAERERFWGGEPSSERELDDAAQKLDPEVKATQKLLEELKKKAEHRSSRDLGKHGDDEGKLAERMKQLSERGKESSLPDQAVRDLSEAHDAARDAENAFKQGNLQRGKDKQHDAQKKLEDAQKDLGDDADKSNGGEGDDSRGNEHTDIPTADAHKGPEEFRRRVMKGLAMPSSNGQKDAVRRYAEGLLK